jgi:hypothetical protein
LDIGSGLWLPWLWNFAVSSGRPAGSRLIDANLIDIAHKAALAKFAAKVGKLPLA